MSQSRSRWFTQFAVVVVAGLLSVACKGEPLAPWTPSPNQVPPTPYEVPPTTNDTLATVRAADLGSCDSLAAPEGTQLALRAYAEGVQIYRWTAGAWTFVAPEAELFANEQAAGVIGTHYAGPTWELQGGSTVKAAVLKRCPSTQGAIPWLLLGVTTTSGSGLLRDVTHIQRIETVAGTAPAAPGTVEGEERRVPYTAVYLFHRTR